MRKLTDRFFQQDDKSIIDTKTGFLMKPLENKYYKMSTSKVIKCSIKRITSKDKPIRIEALLLRIDKDKLCFTNFFSLFIHPLIPYMDCVEGSRYIADVVRDEDYPSNINIKWITRIS